MAAATAMTPIHIVDSSEEEDGNNDYTGSKRKSSNNVSEQAQLIVDDDSFDNDGSGYPTGNKSRREIDLVEHPGKAFHDAPPSSGGTSALLLNSSSFCKQDSVVDLTFEEEDGDY